MNDGEQILHATIELADQQPLPLFDTLALSDVDHNGEHKVPPLGPDRLKPDLDRDLAAVTASRQQVAARSGKISRFSKRTSGKPERSLILKQQPLVRPMVLYETNRPACPSPLDN